MEVTHFSKIFQKIATKRMLKLFYQLKLFILSMFTKISLKRQVRHLVTSGEKLQIIVGANNVKISQWISFDQNQLDITMASHWALYFKISTIDNILAEHVWEHLTPLQASSATELCFYFLKQGARLRIAVPDLYHISGYYCDLVSAKGSMVNVHNHQVDYNYKNLNNLLISHGFKTELLDWWDENGIFHSKYVDDEHGHIKRSFNNWPNYDNRFCDRDEYEKLLDGVPPAKRMYILANKIHHTSLIIDAVK